MPSPKMLLNNVSINQPAYGAYRSYIHTGIKWSFVGDNWRGYDIGYKYLRSELSLQLDETQINNLTFDYSQQINLELAPGHGFYPFSPVITPLDNIYPIHMIMHNYSGVLKSPWKYTECKIGMLLNDQAIINSMVYTQEQQIPNEGTVSLWDGGRDRDNAVTAIREINQPPTLSLPDYYNVAITQTGVNKSITRKLPSYENAGITSEINITGSYSKMNKILLYLLSVGRNTFYVCMPDNYYDGTEPANATLDPDYWLFGRKIPMNKYQCTGTGFARWFYGWKVRCINNPIEVQHDNLRHFTVTLKLALEV